MTISWSAALILRYCASGSERHGLASAVSVHPAFLRRPPRNGGHHHNDRSQQGRVVHAAQRIIQPGNHNWTSAGVCRLRLWWDLHWFPPALLGGAGLRSRQQAEHGVAAPMASPAPTLLCAKPKKSTFHHVRSMIRSFSSAMSYHEESKCFYQWVITLHRPKKRNKRRW